MSNEKRINKINEKRIIILSAIKDSLIKSENIASEIDDMASVIKMDEANIKEYNQIAKWKEIILSLMQEINNCHDVEEIKKLRRKVNYYINKIKKELANRNILEKQINSYMEKTAYLRKGIANYVSYLKREPKIQEINILSDNYDNLSEEEKEKLSKLLANETRYNRSILKRTSEEIVVSKHKKDKSVEPVNKGDIEHDFDEWVKKELYNDKRVDNGSNFEEWLDEEFARSEQEAAKKIVFNGDVGDYIDQIKAFIKSDTDDERKKKEYDSLVKRTNFYRTHYNIEVPKKYGDSRSKNIVIFFENIPKYVHNKGAIRKMQHDYNNHSRVNDFRSYIEYTEKSNRITRLFNQLFSRTALASHENVCLNNHSKCAEWIIEHRNNQTKTLERA